MDYSKTAEQFVFAAISGDGPTARTLLESVRQCDTRDFLQAYHQAPIPKYFQLPQLQLTSEGDNLVTAWTKKYYDGSFIPDDKDYLPLAENVQLKPCDK